MGVLVVWECGGRRCKAETVTQVGLRKPAATAQPKGANAGYTAGEVKELAARSRARLRERGETSLAALAAADEVDELFGEEDAAGRECRRVGTAEEYRNFREFLEPLPTMGEVLGDKELAAWLYQEA